MSDLRTMTLIFAPGLQIRAIGLVYAKQQFHTPKYVVEYLGRCTHKIAISNYQIKQLEKAKRTGNFLIKDYRKAGKKEQLQLKTEEFVRRFALYVLPEGFTRIRHYGILSSGWKKEKLPTLQKCWPQGR